MPKPWADLTKDEQTFAMHVWSLIKESCDRSPAAQYLARKRTIADRYRKGG